MSNREQGRHLSEACKAAGHLYVADLQEFDACPLCTLVDQLTRESKLWQDEIDRCNAALRKANA